MKTIIVTGGRDYEDFAMVHDVLDFIAPERIIQGGCPDGADLLAKDYADSYGIESVTVQADWNEHGKKAGPIRNRKMIEAYPDAIVVAFPGGKGTENCVKTAVALNRIVLRVEP